MERALEICSDLVAFNTVTPGGRAILEYAESVLKKLGFSVEILTFQSQDGANIVDNLYAEYVSNPNGRKLGFLGHLDVVPPGDGWSFDPFKATISDGKLYGRGIADMKGGAGCFLAVLERSIEDIDGTVSIFLTCDEEIGTYEGARALLDWAVEHNKIPDHCLIGEPSSDKKICDRIYIGHRGSVNIEAHASGIQAHSAYISKDTKNSALEKICSFINDVAAYNFKHNDKRFPECIASATMISSANIAQNVIPASSSVNFNVRFSADYTSGDIVDIFRALAEKYEISITYTPSGEPYICEDEFLLDVASSSIIDVLGYKPTYSAGGGTSDGRFMIKHCPIVEIGMVDATIHQVDEHIDADDCERLASVYERFIERYFGN